MSDEACPQIKSVTKRGERLATLARMNGRRKFLYMNRYDELIHSDVHKRSLWICSS